jgi:hypothetical protein
MLSQGYERQSLAHAQKTALLVAAQRVQYQLQHARTVTVSQLKDFTEEALAGKSPMRPGHSEITPGHIAFVIHEALFRKTLRTKHLLQESWILVNTPLPPDIYGPEPQRILMQWLAKNLALLKFHAGQMETNLPGFARTLRESVAKIESSWRHTRSLKLAVKRELAKLTNEDMERRRRAREIPDEDDSTGGDHG